MRQTNWLTIILLMLTVPMLAQTVTQKGVAYQYNGKKARTPLGNVSISYDADKRKVVSDEQNGSFTLMLEKRRMGDRIGLVTVKKREMMVFNQHAVDEWSVRKEPLMLILCNAEEFERQKENLISIGRREAKKKYDRQKAELERQVAEGKMQIAEKDAALDKAYDELDRLNKNVGEYADLFARIDESEIDTLAQRALDLYNQGQVEEAIRLFEQGNYMEKLDKALKHSQQADELKAVAEQAKEQATQDSLKALQSLKAQIEAYKLNNEWDKARVLLKGLADRLNTVDDCWAYAYFCDNQNHFKDTEEYYKRANELLGKEQAKETTDFQNQKASLLNSLAILYSKIQRFTESEAMYKEALEIRRRLAQANPQAYEPDVAMTLNNLASLYSDTQRFTESEAMYKEALEIYRRLAQTNPQAYEPDVALTLNNLAILYSDTQRFTESEAMYKETLEIYRRLAQTNPQAYEPDVAQTQYNLGMLKVQQELYPDAITSFEEALEIYRRLAKASPAQQQWYEGSLYYLSQLYPVVKNYSAAYRINKEWLPILKKMYEENPDAVKSDYAGKLGSQSFNALFMKQFDESEQLAHEGLAVDSTQHWIATNLAAALLFQGKYAEAEKIYREYKSELKDGFLDDFRQLAEARVIPKEREDDVEKIKQILNE